MYQCLRGDFMRLLLDNLFYTTSDPNRIEELQSFGALIVSGEKEEVKDELKIDDNSNLKNLKVEELEKLCDEKGLDRGKAKTKAELIELLK